MTENRTELSPRDRASFSMGSEAPAPTAAVDHPPDGPGRPCADDEFVPRDEESDSGFLGFWMRQGRARDRRRNEPPQGAAIGAHADRAPYSRSRRGAGVTCHRPASPEQGACSVPAPGDGRRSRLSDSGGDSGRATPAEPFQDSVSRARCQAPSRLRSQSRATAACVAGWGACRRQMRWAGTGPASRRGR